MLFRCIPTATDSATNPSAVPHRDVLGNGLVWNRKVDLDHREISVYPTILNSRRTGIVDQFEMFFRDYNDLGEEKPLVAAVLICPATGYTDRVVWAAPLMTHIRQPPESPKWNRPRCTSRLLQRGARALFAW